MEKLELLCTVGGNVKWCSHWRTMDFLKKLKIELPMIQQLHFWVYNQNNWKQGLEEIFVHPCLPKTWKQPKCLRTDEWISKIWYIQTVGASLVAQWLRIRLSMQGTRVQALVREDPTCRGATKPVRHNYWACALEPTSHNYWSPRA